MWKNIFEVNQVSRHRDALKSARGTSGVVLLLEVPILAYVLKMILTLRIFSTRIQRLKGVSVQSADRPEVEALENLWIGACEQEWSCHVTVRGGLGSIRPVKTWSPFYLFSTKNTQGRTESKVM